MAKIVRQLFESYPEALSALTLALNKREFSPDEYYVVLCPDRYTLAVEQALFCGEGGRGGALDLEVLTLSRLARRVAPAAKTLSQEGGIMITARAIAAVKDKLSYYGRAAAFDDFAREVYATIQQIVSSDPPEKIEADGATQMKLDDLMLIKAEYDKIKAQSGIADGENQDDGKSRNAKCMDASDKLYSLIAAAPTSKEKVIDGVHFFAIGYAEPTKLISRVFSALAAPAKSFTLYDAPPIARRRGELDLFCAPDGISEYKRVAVEIRDYVDGGGDYDDIAVVCNNPRALKRILGEYEIPSYTDESKSLYSTQPLAAIDNIYKLYIALNKRNAVDCSALVALAKNPYAGCDRMQAEMLAFEVGRRALRYVSADFEFTGEGGVAAKRALGIVREFCACSSFGAAVGRVLDACKFAEVQRGQAERGTDVVTPIVGLVELLGRYGSGDFEVDARAFLSAARAVNVNTLPRERHCVTVTVPSALRMTAVKKLFITDFNEGVMPSAIADTGLISDAELDMLGGVIEPTCAVRNRRSRDELRAVVLNAKNVFVTYTSVGGKDGGKVKGAAAVSLGSMSFIHTGRPAYAKRNRERGEAKAIVIDADRIFDGKYLKKKRLGGMGKPATFIVDLAKKLRVYESAKCDDALLKTHDPAVIAKYAPVPAAAREVVARNLSRYASSVDAATEKCKAVYAPFADRINISHRPKLSSSEITNWFYCPYKRFLHDTVRLADRKRGFEANDFGTVLHGFMKKFLSTNPYDYSESAVEKLIDEVLTELEYELDPPTRRRVLANAAAFAQKNAYILSKGKYEVEKMECHFSGKTLGNRSKFEFSGDIDRYDLCGDRARIIDYKTGDKKFDIKQCLDGRDMQLELYAYALSDEYDVTGMFYVRMPKRYYTDKPDRPMSGTMIKDIDIALEYDKTLEAGGDWSDIITMKLNSPDKKTGVVGFRKVPKSYTLLDEDKFKALLAACKLNADVAADEIADGFIMRSPADKACEFCSYIGICGGGVVRVPDIDLKSVFGEDAPEVDDEDEGDD
ncbi:MAG: PD-(D/E)XK nuclease family protein [Clostridiales bacterium]|nr:PD-(D/E)XK nuclease family protein [Clostridiales bacterium]